MARDTVYNGTPSEVEDEKKKGTMDRVNSIGNYMLPSGFRKRSLLSQRSFLITIVFIYAFAVGFLTYSFLGVNGDTGSSIAEKFKLVAETGEVKIAIMSYVAAIITMFMGGFFMFWTRSRNHWISGTEFVGYMLPPIIFIAGIQWMDGAEGRNLGDFIDRMKLVQAGIAFVPLAYGIMLAILRMKTFSEIRYRALWIAPSIAIVGATGFLQSMLIDSGVEYDFTTMTFMIGPLIVGVLLCSFGVLMSSGKSPFQSENIWSQFRFTGALPAILAFAPLLAISFRTISNDFGRIGEIFAVKETLYCSIIMVSLVVVFIMYALVRGRIKNVAFTNPWHNELILKSMVIMNAIVALIGIKQLENVTLPNYSFHSFFLVGLMSMCALIISTVAHFANLVTYTKFYKTVIAGAAFSTVIIQVIILYVSTLPYSHMIQDILARQFAIAFVVLTVAADAITLFINVGYIFLDSLSIQKAKRAIAAREEEYERMQDIGADEVIDDNVEYDKKKKKKRKGAK